MSSISPALIAWSDTVMNKLDRRRRLPLLTLVSTDESCCSDTFEYVTGTITISPGPSSSLSFTSDGYDVGNTNPSHIGSSGICVAGTLHGTSFGGCAALVTRTAMPMSAISSSPSTSMSLHPPLCFSSDTTVAIIAAAAVVRGAVGVIFPSIESVGRHQLLLELAAAARLSRLAAPGMLATGELLPQSSLIIMIYSDDSSSNSTSQQQELTDWIFRTETIYKDGSNLCGGVRSSHVKESHISSIYNPETKVNNSNFMIKDPDAVERNELRVTISSMYRSCNVVIVNRVAPESASDGNTSLKFIISPERLTQLRSTIRRILLECDPYIEPFDTTLNNTTAGHPLIQSPVSRYSSVMSPGKAADRVARLLMAGCYNIHVARDLGYDNKVEDEFMDNIHVADVKLPFDSTYSNTSHLSILVEKNINDSDTLKMEVDEETLWVEKKLESIMKSNFIGYCTARQANLTEEVVMSAYQSTKNQCQKLLLLLEMRGNNNTHIDGGCNGNQEAGEKEYRKEDQKRKVDGATVLLDPSSSPLYPHRSMEDAKKRFILVARANAQARNPAPCAITVRSDIAISGRVGEGGILLSRRAGEMARNTKRGAIVMRDTTSWLVTQYRIWAEHNIPHRYQFWFSGYGALIVAGLFFFVVLSYWSR